MNFDELTKSVAQSVTRRAALKRFGIGLAGMALASLGLANSAQAGDCLPGGSQCFIGRKGNPGKVCRQNCCSRHYVCGGLAGITVCSCTY